MRARQPRVMCPEHKAREALGHRAAHLQSGARDEPMKIAYVCTNYNNSHDTISAIRSLRKGDAVNCRVVVVDNASEQREQQILRQFCSTDNSTDLVCSEVNTGYFGGLNIGLEQIARTAPNCDVVVIGNNDLLFPKDFVQSLKGVTKTLEKYPVVSPDIVTVDGQHQNPHVIEGISNFRERVYDLVHANYWLAVAIRKGAQLLHRFVRRGDEDNYETAMEIEQGHGSCYLLTPRFFSDYGKLWAPTFLFGEEYFLSLQLKRKGEKVYYEPGVSVTHVWHSSLRHLPSRKQWELAKAAHAVYRKHNPIRKVS